MRGLALLAEAQCSGSMPSHYRGQFIKLAMALATWAHEFSLVEGDVQNEDS